MSVGQALAAKRMSVGQGMANPSSAKRASTTEEGALLQRTKPGLIGKKQGSLGAYTKGQSSGPAEGQPAPVQSAPPRGGPGMRPRPGEIEQPQPNAGPLGSPAIGVRVAPGDSARRVMVQQDPLPINAGQRLAPGQTSPIRQQGFNSPGAPQPRSAQGSAMGSPRGAPDFAPRPMSPRPGSNMMGSGPGAPLQPAGALSPRGKMSPGPQKPGVLGKRQPDQFSAMSTVSHASVSEDSAPQRFGRMPRGAQQGVPAARERDFNPITNSPRAVSFPQASPQSPRAMSPRGVFARKPDAHSPQGYSPKMHKPEEADAQPSGPGHKECPWTTNAGHYDPMPLNFDKGVDRQEKSKFDKFDNVQALVTQAVRPAGSSPSHENDKHNAEYDMSKKHCLAQTAGTDMKLTLICPLPRETCEKGLSRKSGVCPANHSSAAGAETNKCYTAYMPPCWQPPGADGTPYHGDRDAELNREQAIKNGGEDDAHHGNDYAHGKIPGVDKALPSTDSSQAKAGIDWDHAGEGHPADVMQHFYKQMYGRSMKLGRQSSEPPRPRDKKKTFQRKSLRHVDWAQDESAGAIVPGLSQTITRKSEQGHLDDHGIGDRKHGGGYRDAYSDFTERLSLNANQQNFRIEQYDRQMTQRSDSCPALRSGSPFRRNPVLGEGIEGDPCAAGRTDRFPRSESPSASGCAESPAGMTTRHLATGASVRSSIVNTNEKHAPGMRGRKEDHGHTHLMTSCMKNTVAKDVDLHRKYREAYDRPFTDLCTAFNQIREHLVHDKERIRHEVNPRNSNHVAAAMCHTERSDSCDYSGRSKQMIEAHARLSPGRGQGAAGQQSPGRGGQGFALPQSPGSSVAGGGGCGRQSPGRQSSFSTQSSVNMEDALKWVR